MIVSGSIIGGIFILFFCHRGLPPVAYIELINKTNEIVKKIIIDHNNGKIVHMGLRTNEKVRYPIYVYGESPYSIDVIFFDAKLKSLSRVGYLEAGYSLHETIYEDNISEKHDVFKICR